MARKRIPRAVQHAVLIKCRRRCALCFYFETDTRTKDGQIAHVDRNPENNAEENLVFLCLEHHDKYDTKPSQSKSFQPEEVRTAKDELENAVKKDLPALVRGSVSGERPTPRKVAGVSIEIYERRYPIYAAFRNFVLSLFRYEEMREEDLKAFVDGTANALFLFGDDIDKYLNEVYRKAMAVRRAQRTIARSDRISEQQWQRAIEKEEDLMLWFEKQLTDGKRLFAKYLRLAG